MKIFRNRVFLSFFFIFLGFFYLIYHTTHPSLPCRSHPVKFYSNELHDDLKILLLHALKRAKFSIFIQMYGLTDPSILKVLKKKKAQGLDVAIFYDKSSAKSIPKKLGAKLIKTSALMHRKIVVIDEKLVFLGSANLTTASLKIHDNLMIALFAPALADFLRRQEEEDKVTFIENMKMRCFLLPESKKNAIDTFCDLIDGAKTQIRGAIFTFTHPKLVDKLIGAKRKGVDIGLAIDRYTAAGASKKALERLRAAGIDLLIHRENQLLHHKWALIDEKTLVLGSANWTRSAFTKNHDFLLVIEELGNKERKILHRLWKAVAIRCEKP